MKKATSHPSKAPPKAPSLPMLLHVVSDSTGNLSKHMVTAFLTQFAPGTFELRLWNFLSTDARLAEALNEIGALGGAVMHAVVASEHKAMIETYCAENDIRCQDMTGHFVDFLASASGVEPAADVKALHEVSEGYHKRIEAIEFTMQHDDGLGVSRLQEADVILVGVSRTSKTPTCIYLAQQGYKAANVAIAIEAPVPDKLLKMKQPKIVGLLIDPLRLIEIRLARHRSWNMTRTSYVEMEHVEQEVQWSRQLFARQGWPTLDVTKTAVEETAAKVIHLLNLPPAI